MAHDKLEKARQLIMGEKFLIGAAHIFAATFALIPEPRPSQMTTTVSVGERS